VRVFSIVSLSGPTGIVPDVRTDRWMTSVLLLQSADQQTLAITLPINLKSWALGARFVLSFHFSAVPKILW
jgi:hypothetical protein